jgi:endogenous inhibitor of DNA gyrase (YacG/DUF329 family)
MNVTCPRCGEERPLAGNPHRPFCSERCKMLDLDRWFSGKYSMPVVEADEDLPDPDEGP